MDRNKTHFQARQVWRVGSGENISFYGWTTCQTMLEIHEFQLSLGHIYAGEIWTADQISHQDRLVKCSHIWAIIFPKIGPLMDDCTKSVNPFSGAMEKRWKHSLAGELEVKNWKLLNHYSDMCPVESVWHGSISVNLSYIYWKLWNNGFATDLNTQKVGISLASKCRCCTAPNVESTLHLFLFSEVATTIWRHYAIPFNITW